MNDQTKNKPQPVKRLYRNQDNQMIAGVCSGLAEYFELDPALVRIVFVLLIFAQVGIPIYIVMWIVLPTKKDLLSKNPNYVDANVAELKTKAQDTITEIRKSKVSKFNPVGIFLVLIGVYFLLLNFGLLDWFQIGRLWPIILIALGILAFRK